MVVTPCCLLIAACHQQQKLETCGDAMAGWLKPSDGIGHLRPHSVVIVDRPSGVEWNGARIDMAALATVMIQSSEMNPVPQIVLKIAPGADCDHVRTVRRIMAASPICSDLKFCGEGVGWKFNSEYGGTEPIDTGADKPHIID